MKKVIFMKPGTVLPKDRGLHIVASAAQISGETESRRKVTGAGIVSDAVTMQGLYRLIWGSALPRVLSITEKEMIIRHCILSLNLGAYEEIKRTDGFLTDITNWIARMRTEGIAPEDIMETDTRYDLQPLYRMYLDTLKQYHWSDPEDLSYLAAEKLADFSFGDVTVSGFLGFRPVELDILDALAGKNKITIEMPYGDPGKNLYLQHIRDRFIRRGYSIEICSDAKDSVPVPAVHLVRGSSHSLVCRGVFGEIAEAVRNNLTVDVVVPDALWIEWLRTEGENIGISFSKPQERTLFQTRLGQSYIKHLQEKESCFDFTQWKRELISGTLSPDSIMLEMKAADAVQTLEEGWELLASAFSYHENQRTDYFLDTLKTSTVHLPAVLGSIPLLTIRECAGQRSKKRIFVGFGEEYQNLEEDNFLLKQPMNTRTDRDTEYLSKALRYEKEICRMEDAIANAENVSFVILETKERKTLSNPFFRRFVGSALSWKLEYDHYIPDADSVFIELHRKYHQKKEVERRKFPRMPLEKIPGLRIYTAASLTSYANCPFQYFVRYRLAPEGVISDSFALRQGNLIHQILHIYIERMKKEIAVSLDIGELPSVNEKELQRIATELNSEAEETFSEWYMEHIIRSVSDFLMADMQRLYECKTFRIAGTETTFSHPHNQSIRIEGRVDRMDEDAKGARWVFDYKTGRSLPDRKSLDEGKQWQLPLYSYAFRQSYVSYAQVMKPGFSHIYAPDPVDSVYTNDWELLQNMYRESIDRLDREILEGNFSPISSRFCKYCAYSAICRKGERDVCK